MVSSTSFAISGGIEIVMICRFLMVVILPFMTLYYHCTRRAEGVNRLESVWLGSVRCVFTFASKFKSWEPQEGLCRVVVMLR